MRFHDKFKYSFCLTSLILSTSTITGCNSGQELKSQVSIDGAAVGFPISLAVAEEYQKVKADAKVSVASSGTGGGFSKFCNGDIDIVGASRTIRNEEIAKCKSKNIEFVELPIGLDGVAVIANPKNKFAQCLTIKEMNTIWSAKSDGKILTWNQVNPKFPKLPLKLYAPASDTGTFDYLTQAVTGKAKNGRTDYTPSHNQNLLVQGVSGDESALGYVGISYYIQNQEKLNLVAIENLKGECKKPVPLDNVLKNTYTPLSRPLFIYVSKISLDNKPVVKEFVDFYLENSWKWVDGAGYVALPDEAYVKVKQKFAAGETGTKFQKAKPGEPITNFI
ncbi:phosphate ABC transporter substrate-binding protein, PhoT family [Trichormus variabilis ATCC 29413]|uniref:Phosphate-binding protein n=3 Tax=Anabaena variabilis TaxID=264691 RepID=Q3MH65_TRIV2|nr:MULTISPECIES: PstS family phosphate ABC transporter substrate-binding protein [Nostocaceae]ABA19671.1 phosphate ABC transporter substrate-binding protein, PhoT family [Trichormus variabilis ATCC 29413]MBC1215821.1 PstS family phosphate ABC transporter substrate-binding protein [Trichormus variabilis ARAD]MBC1265964.1 PstS family phosphate ABC transporter substrate-binding protein [Trichormus variabilis FSR]MBC1302238.1 PstS family phosphate ABC transporter substrate-binding protein [Trichorm